MQELLKTKFNEKVRALLTCFAWLCFAASVLAAPGDVDSLIPRSEAPQFQLAIIDSAGKSERLESRVGVLDNIAPGIVPDMLPLARRYAMAISD